MYSTMDDEIVRSYESLSRQFNVTQTAKILAWGSAGGPEDPSSRP